MVGVKAIDALAAVWQTSVRSDRQETRFYLPDEVKGTIHCVWVIMQLCLLN